MKRWVGFLLLAFLGCCIPCFKGQAQTVGVQGSVYEIQEQDALVWIERRLKTMQATGEVKRNQEQLNIKALASIERPSFVKGLKPTEVPRVIEKDLTIVIPIDIKNSQGELIHRAGTRINPLTKVFSKKFLIFFDGEDEKQLNWALEEYKSQFGLVKLVLVKGSPLALMQQYEIPFYFDQAGRLSRYFKLEQIPAKVFQEKEKLMITEVKM